MKSLLHAPAVCAALLFCLNFPSLAQVPGPLVPGRQQPIEAPQPQSVPTPAPPVVSPTEAPPGGGDIRFFLNALTIEGAKAVHPEKMKDIWLPYIGKNISVATLYEIAGKITRRYAEEGYALSFAFLPEQEIEGGNVTIRVTEGFVDEAVFEGDAAEGLSLLGKKGGARKEGLSSEEALKKIQECGFDCDLLADAGQDLDIPAIVYSMTQKIVESRPLRTRDLERYVLLMNDIPGYDIQTVFKPSPKTPGSSTLVVKINHKRVEAEISADDGLSASLGHQNVGVTATVNSIASSADALQIMQRCGLFCDIYSATSVNYTRHVGDEGMKVAVNASMTTTQPQSGLLTLLGFEGSERSFGVDVSYPLLRSRDRNLTVGANFKYSNNETETFGGILTRDFIRTLGFYGVYDFADATGGISLIRADLTHGLPVFGATDGGDPFKSRAGGSATFNNFGLYMSRTQPLALILPEFGEYTLFGAMRGQLAMDEALLSASQCYYGGSEIGRGYDSGALSGDHCVSGLLEVRRNFVVGEINLQAYGFGDMGLVWRKGNALGADEKKRVFAQSIGIGVRAGLSEKLSGGIEIGLPLRESFTSNQKDTPRMVVTMTYIY